MNKYELQLIANQVAQFLDIATTPIVEIKPVKRGLARPKTGKITIPDWVLSKKCKRQAYQKYYVTHEVVHFHTGLNHGAEFKKVEAAVLSELFAIRILRSDRPPYPWRLPPDHRVYPYALVDKETAEMLWCESSMKMGHLEDMTHKDRESHTGTASGFSL